MSSRYIKIFMSLISTLFLYGCSITPTPVEDSDQLNQTYTKLHQLLLTQQPVNHSITLSEAIARTLKYNLDHRVQKAKLALEAGNLKLAYIEMLPALDVEGNYSFRNNELIQNNVVNGQVTNGSQSFTPREIRTASAGLQWDLLDLGLSYTRAQQQANRVMIAEEQRRKITQQLIQEVVTAYWKAWTAQIMLNEVKAFKNEAEEALEKSRLVSQEKARASRYELSYQQILIKAIRKANQLSMQIDSAKSNLVRLMNAVPGSDFTLTKPDSAIAKLPEIKPELEKMDMLALIYRPELREASYLAEIAHKGIQSAIISMLPGLRFDLGYNYSNNQFLLNNTWFGGNINTTWNLINAVLQGPMSISIAKQNYNLEQLKQLATTMAVLTQIRVSYRSYLQWKDDFEYAEEQSKVSNQLYENSKKLLTAKQGTQQNVIQQGIEALNSKFESQVAYSNAQEALSKLYQSVGIDTLDINESTLTLELLTKLIREKLELQGKGDFNRIIQEKYTDLETLIKEEKAKLATDKKADINPQEKVKTKTQDSTKSPKLVLKKQQTPVSSGILRDPNTVPPLHPQTLEEKTARLWSIQS